MRLPFQPRLALMLADEWGTAMPDSPQNAPILNVSRWRSCLTFHVTALHSRCPAPAGMPTFDGFR